MAAIGPRQDWGDIAVISTAKIEQQKAQKRKDNREYMALVRAAVFASHFFEYQTHCRDCRRQYARDWMRKMRKKKRATNGAKRETPIKWQQFENK